MFRRAKDKTLQRYFSLATYRVYISYLTGPSYVALVAASVQRLVYARNGGLAYCIGRGEPALAGSILVVDCEAPVGRSSLFCWSLI